MNIFVCLCVIQLSMYGVWAKCQQVEDGRMFQKCLHRWKMFGETAKRSSIYFEKPELTDEICQRKPGKSIEDVERCIRSTVSPLCGVLHAMWAGIKLQMGLLCKHRKEFISYADCRNDHRVVTAYNRCSNDFRDQHRRGIIPCVTYGTMLECYTRSVKAYCSESSAMYFKAVFTAYNGQILAYFGCKSKKSRVEVMAFEDNPPRNVETTEHKESAFLHTSRSLHTRGMANGTDGNKTMKWAITFMLFLGFLLRDLSTNW